MKTSSSFPLRPSTPPGVNAGEVSPFSSPKPGRSTKGREFRTAVPRSEIVTHRQRLASAGDINKEKETPEKPLHETVQDLIRRARGEDSTHDTFIHFPTTEDNTLKRERTFPLLGVTGKVPFTFRADSQNQRSSDQEDLEDKVHGDDYQGDIDTREENDTSLSLGDPEIEETPEKEDDQREEGTTSEKDGESDDSIDMADNQEMRGLKVKSFTGTDAEDIIMFLEAVELSFGLFERTIGQDRRERSKLVYLYSCLEGNALSWWTQLEAGKKDTWEHATAALRTRFGRTRARVGMTQAQLDVQRAQASLNSLQQGSRTYDEYLQYVDDLHDILSGVEGGDHDPTLAKKFVQGIKDPLIRRMVNVMVTEVTYENVREVYLKATKEEREVEAQQRLVEETAKLGKDEGFTKSLLEVQASMAQMMKDNQMSMAQMVKDNQRIMEIFAQTIRPVNRGQYPSTSGTPFSAQSAGVGRGRGLAPTAVANPSSSDSTRVPGPTCFNCGQKGHYRSECTNVPQNPRQVWNQQPLEQMTGAGKTVSANAVVMDDELFEEEVIDLGGDLESSGTLGGKVSTNMVELVGVVETEREETDMEEEAEVAAVGKRGRETTSSENRSYRPVQKKVRTKGTMKKKRKRRNPLEAVIRAPRMMEGQPKWDYVKEIRDLPITVTMGHLLSMAPTVRAGLAYSMIIPRKPRKGKTAKTGEDGQTTRDEDLTMQETHRATEGGDKAQKARVRPASDTNLPTAVTAPGLRPIAVPVTRFAKKGGQDHAQSMAVHDVIAEPTDEIVNFHTEGKIRVKGSDKRIRRILIDGGSVVNLMLDGVARELGLTYIENDGRRLQIRTASGDLVPIRYHVRFDLNVAGVTANVRAYIISMVTTYTLLLGRRWMKQVKASGNYRQGTYEIEGLDGTKYKVPECQRGGQVKTTGPGTHVLSVDHAEVHFQPNIVREVPEFNMTEEDEDISWLCETANRMLGRVVNQVVGSDDERPGTSADDGKAVTCEDSSDDAEGEWSDEDEDEEAEESDEEGKDEEY